MTAVTFQSLVVLFISGIAVGILIDAARLMKDRLPYTYSKYVHLAVELLIWFGCGALTFYLLYRWQDGHWRFINFIVQIAGILFYDYFLFRIIRLIIRITVYSIITPFLVLYNVVSKILSILLRFTFFVRNLFVFWRTR